jgi:hypothetical protein
VIHAVLCTGETRPHLAQKAWRKIGNHTATNKKTSPKASDCDFDEVPPWNEEDFSRAMRRIGMKEVGREEFRRAVQAQTKRADARKMLCNESTTQ